MKLLYLCLSFILLQTVELLSPNAPYLPGSELVTDNMRNTFLEEHNKIRKIFGRNNLKWHDDLELYSQLRAREIKEECNFNHRPQKAGEGAVYAENLATAGGYDFDLIQYGIFSIFQWSNESSMAMGVANIFPELEKRNDPAFTKKVFETTKSKAMESTKAYRKFGHFLTVVDMEKDYVGCSYSLNIGKKCDMDYILVCQYSFLDVPKIPNIPLNQPLFDLVTDANAIKNPKSSISVARYLTTSIDAFHPPKFHERLKGKNLITAPGPPGDSNAGKNRQNSKKPDKLFADGQTEVKDVKKEELPTVSMETGVKTEEDAKSSTERDMTRKDKNIKNSWKCKYPIKKGFRARMKHS